MDKNLKFKIEYQKELKKITSQKRIYSCLIPGCTNNATTTSHVLQQSKILESILDDTNHFYSIKQNDLFKMEEDGSLKFERSSLKNTFKFPLYCKIHDDSVFSQIEKTQPIDWNNRKNVLLQTYRTIGMELRKKEIYLDCINAIKRNRKDILGIIDYIDLRPAQLSLKDLSYFKTELEKELFNDSAPLFVINTQFLQKKEICFTSALSIFDANNLETHEYDEWGYTKETPITRTFVNYFPYYDKSILIVVQHKNFICNWTNEFLLRMQKPENYEKELSDLLTYRIEEWAISTKLFNMLSDDKKENLLTETRKYWDYYEYELKTEFNLFK